MPISALYPLPSRHRRTVFGAALLWSLTTFATLLAQPAETPAPRQFSRPILVGASTDSFPNSFAGSAGRCEGFAVDILDAVSRAMNIPIERITAPAGDLQRRFTSGEFDMLQALSLAPGRERGADFSTPFLELQGGIFVRDDDARIQKISDLNGTDFVIVGHGSIGEKFLADLKLKPRAVTYVSSVSDALRLINSGRHDAVFSSRLTALSMIDREKLRNLRPLLVAINGYDVLHCFAVHKGDTALLTRLNEGLAIIHRTGEFDAIYRKWYGHFDSPIFSREQVVTYVAATLGLALLAAVVGLLRQRTLRRQLSRQTGHLAASKALLAEAQQIAHVGHWSFEVSSRRLDCSAETLRIVERDPSLPPPSYARLLCLLPPAERFSAHRSIREAVLTGVACELTLSIRPPTGARKIVHLNIHTDRTPEGRVYRLFGTVQDITHRVTAEERLRSREQLLRALYENVPIAMGVVEISGDSFRFVSANPGTAVVLGLPPVVLVDRVLSDLPVLPEARDFWTHWFRQGNQSPDIVKAEPRMTGSGRDYALTLVPLGGAYGESTPQLCYLIEDITERKQIDSELAQGRKLRAIGELVGGIAHEFNNLLTPILLKTEIIAEELQPHPHLLEDLRTITSAAQRGADLTRRLLAFGRRTDTRGELVELRSAVKANVELIQPTLDRRIQLFPDLPADLPPLYLNSSDLHQIILNLVLNARDALIEKIERGAPDSWRARIRIHAARYQTASFDSGPKTSVGHGWTCLCVEDNGTGMSPEVQERIFEPFYTTKGIGKGTGLGLATVWHAVIRMGGKINVVSRLDEGTTFQIWLPLSPAPSASGARSPKSENTSTPPARILLVEDDELVARTLVTTLRRQRHDVAHFAHGVDAWRHLASDHAYDLVVLDLDLPGISGIEIARRLRGTRFTGRILVASGRMTDTELQELGKLRIEGTLEKPFTAQTLHAAVQACLLSPLGGATPPA